MLVAADLKRPAAIDQLEVLGEQIGVPVYTERGHLNAVKVCRNGIGGAQDRSRRSAPRYCGSTRHRRRDHERGQQRSARTARAASDLSRARRDDRSGRGTRRRRSTIGSSSMAAFSPSSTPIRAVVRRSPSRSVTGKPIKYIGMGEKLEALEEFHPERVAGQHPGYGRHRLTLVEQAQQQYDAGRGGEAREADGEGVADARRLPRPDAQDAADGLDEGSSSRRSRAWATP
jgi:signal recognition particle subunit SRP54